MSAHVGEIKVLNATARCLADLALRMSGEPLPTVGEADFLVTQAITLLGELRSSVLFSGRDEPRSLDLADASAFALLLCVSSLDVPRESTLTAEHCETLDEHVMRTLELISYTIKALGDDAAPVAA